MADTPPNPAQVDQMQEISYTSKEGHDYSEVHGDPNQNITVTSLAEKEGAVQPNLEGTTPDPHNPRLTEQEAERRGLTVEGQPLDQAEPPAPTTTTRGSTGTSDPTTTESGQKQAQSAPNKAQTPSEKK